MTPDSDGPASGEDGGPEEAPMKAATPEAMETMTSPAPEVDEWEALCDRAGRLARLGYGPVPVRTGDKHPPADGFIGGKNPNPSYADWHAFTEDNPRYRNLAARLPEGVVGVDIDGYRPGGAESYAKIKDLLPATVLISARLSMGDDDPHPDYVYDGFTGIYLYRSDLASGGMPGIDLITNGNRHAMAPGSTHPGNETLPPGRIYQVVDQRTGEFVLPAASDLPAMPAALRQHLEATTTRRASNVGGTTGTALDASQPCRYNDRMLDQFRAIDWSGDSDSRHAELLRITNSVIKGQGEGHRGLFLTLREMLAVWSQHLPQRVDEFERAVGKAFPVLGPFDPCDPRIDPFGLGNTEPLSSSTLTPAAGDLNGDGGPGGAADEGDDEFWASRAWLEWCRHEARRLGHGPWAFVGAALAWTAAIIAPEVTVDVGKGPISLNTYVMLVGGPSTGKTLAFGTVEDARPDWNLIPTGVGSGEGIARAFVNREDAMDEVTGEKRKNAVVQHTFRAIMFEDEWARALAAKNSGRGGTIDSVLRTAWMGGHLGQANRSEDTTLPVRKHHYRLCVVAGSQIDPAMDILNDEATGLGTSQRWLMFRTTKAEEDESLTPLPFPHSIPSKFIIDRGMLPFKVQVTPEVRAAFKAYRAQETEPDNEHQALRTIKIAADVTLIEGRTEIALGDWNLALWIDAHSTRVKRWLRVEAAAKKVEAKRAARTSDALLNAEVEETVADIKMQRLAGKMWRAVQRHTTQRPEGHGDRCTMACLSQASKVKEDVRAPAVEMLSDLRWLAFEEGKTGDVVKGGKQDVTWVSLGPSEPPEHLREGR